MGFTIDAGDVIAGFALLFSIYATITTSRFNNRQRSLIESQERLNSLLLEKEKLGSISDKKADLGASFIKLGRSQFRLKIWNKGKCPARNVRLEFPEGNDFVPQSEIDAKLPLEALEQYQSIELLTYIHFGSKSKHVVKLIWSDDHDDQNEKLSYPTL
jgi:hypothetical protein